MARSIWAGSHVLLMRQPSVHSHLCARQELPDGERPISVADQLVREWHGYRSLLVANGFNVCHLPEVEGEGRESADAQFVRDGMTVTPAGNIIFSRFAPQSKHRQAETDCYSGLFDRGWLEQFGISSGAARLLPAEDETFEGGDIEFFKVKGRWVAVIGLSARTNRGGVERVSDFLRTEGVSSVVIPVRRENNSGARIPAMHWTTHGQRIGAHSVALKYDYFGRPARRALRTAGIQVFELPNPESERWSGGFFVSQRPNASGKAIYAFSRDRHVQTNEWLDRLGLTVVPVPFDAHFEYAEGSTDCTVNPIWFRAA